MMKIWMEMEVILFQPGPEEDDEEEWLLDEDEDEHAHHGARHDLSLATGRRHPGQRSAALQVHG